MCTIIVLKSVDHARINKICKVKAIKRMTKCNASAIGRFILKNENERNVAKAGAATKRPSEPISLCKKTLIPANNKDQ